MIHAAKINISTLIWRYYMYMIIISMFQQCNVILIKSRNLKTLAKKIEKLLKLIR